MGNTNSQRAQKTNEIHTFCYEKLGLEVKYQVLLGKKWFSSGQPTSSKEKDGFGKENQLFPKIKQNTKKTTLWETMRPKSKMIVFWFFLGKSWFSYPKPSFP